MVRYFSYEGDPMEVLMSCKEIIEGLNYEIEIYAPESRLLITVPQIVKKDIRRYNYAVILQVEDLIEIILSAQRFIFKRSSEVSIGGRELTESQTADRLPYSIQQKIFWPIEAAFEQAGYQLFEQEAKDLRSRG
jgi:hypothetical protein